MRTKHTKKDLSSAMLEQLIERDGLVKTTRSINIYRVAIGIKTILPQTVARYSNGYNYPLPYSMIDFIKTMF